MKKWTALLLVGWMGVVSSFAQAQPTPRGGARPAPAGPKGEAKLRWVCHRLGLSEEQKQQVESLIVVYNAELADRKADVEGMRERMKGKFSEITDAKRQGDNEAVARLQEEMKQMMPDAAAEQSFFEALDSVLTPKQKERVAMLRERAKTASQSSMRPYHALKVALDLGLTREQVDRLESVLEAFREDVQTNRPKDQADRDQRVEKLVDSIRGILTPEQVTQYDEKIATLRLDAPAPKRTAAAESAGPAGPSGNRPRLLKPNPGQATPAPAREAPPTTGKSKDDEN